jgi:hypothetical protein
MWSRYNFTGLVMRAIYKTGSSLSEIRINFNNHGLSNITMYFNSFYGLPEVRHDIASILSALEKVGESNLIKFNKSDIVFDHNPRLMFFIKPENKEQFENIFALIQRYSQLPLPLKYINEFAENVYPAASVIANEFPMKKTAGTALAAAATAGLLFWGYRAAKNYFTTDENNNHSENEMESSEPTLFNSFGFAPE